MTLMGISLCCIPSQKKFSVGRVANKERVLNKSKLFTITSIECISYEWSENRKCGEYNMNFHTKGRLTLNQKHCKLRYSELYHLHSVIEQCAKRYKIRLKRGFPDKKSKFLHDHSAQEFLKEREKAITATFKEALSQHNELFILDISWAIRYWLNDGLGLSSCNLSRADFVSEGHSDCTRASFVDDRGRCVKCKNSPADHSERRGASLGAVACDLLKTDFARTEKSKKSQPILIVPEAGEVAEDGEEGRGRQYSIKIEEGHSSDPHLLRVADELEKRAEESLRHRPSSDGTSSVMSLSQPLSDDTALEEQNNKIRQLEAQVISYVADISEMQVSNTARVEDINRVETKLENLRKEIKELKAELAEGRRK